jgi:hypothetical protein
VSLDTTNLIEQARHPDFDAPGFKLVRDLADALEAVEADRNAAVSALGEPCAECGHIDWRSHESTDSNWCKRL